MPSLTNLILLGAFALMTPLHGDQDKDKDQPASALDFTMKSLDGKEVDLNKYQGQVVLIVNVASQCGLTKQYKGLQELHEKYGKQGFVILGFPCNQFGGQEPGTAEEIAAFCEKDYGVTFDLFEKIDVNDDKACPLYKFLTSKETNPEFSGPITWNFAKFLIGSDGQVVARFEPSTTPEDKTLVATIEEELKKVESSKEKKPNKE